MSAIFAIMFMKSLAALTPGIVALAARTLLVRKDKEVLNELATRHAVELANAEAARCELLRALEHTRADDAEKNGQLNHLVQENARLKNKLDKHSQVTRRAIKSFPSTSGRWRRPGSR